MVPNALSSLSSTCPLRSTLSRSSHEEQGTASFLASRPAADEREAIRQERVNECREHGGRPRLEHVAQRAVLGQTPRAFP